MKFNSFKEFYPFYLQEHSNLVSRRLHFVGTSFVIFILAASFITRDFRLLPLIPVVGYGFAWIGHFVFEKNRPATFKHPLYSLMGDFRMFWDILTKKIPAF
jgi:hypothetical protein